MDIIKEFCELNYPKDKSRHQKLFIDGGRKYGIEP
jgi:hypothetical protein